MQTDHGPTPRFIAASLLALAWWASVTPFIDFARALTDPETAIVILVWSLAAIAALWLGASVLYWRHRLRVAPPNRGRLERFCVPGSKRIAQGLVAVSLTMLPACGQSDAPPPQLVHLGQADPTATSMTTTTLTPPTTGTAPTSAPSTTAPSTTAQPTTSPSATTPSTTTASTTSAPLASNTETPPETTADDEEDPADEIPAEHLVVAGDHLWGIAAETTELRLGHVPSTAEVSEYWAKLIATNRSRLSSGDPNLIYPGETIALP